MRYNATEWKNAKEKNLRQNSLTYMVDKISGNHKTVTYFVDFSFIVGLYKIVYKNFSLKSL